MITLGRILAGTLLMVAAEPMLIADAAAGAWVETTWNGERAFEAGELGWCAIVSIDRGRLVYFGRPGRDENLLFAPATREAAAGWGGHRLWLGPQVTWPGGWPPAAAWEASAAATVACEGKRLTLVMPEAGEGWPSLVREYAWEAGRLHCNARISGGTRPAQIIHILQVPPTAVATAARTPTAQAPRGYVQVHLGRRPSPQPDFPPPSHVVEEPGTVAMHCRDSREKLGFAPQPLAARIGSARLRVERGPGEGLADAIPDDGFVTQVYLGSGDSALLELEQLSPLWARGGRASFAMVISAEALD